MNESEKMVRFGKFAFAVVSLIVLEAMMPQTVQQTVPHDQDKGAPTFQPSSQTTANGPETTLEAPIIGNDQTPQNRAYEAVKNDGILPYNTIRDEVDKLHVGRVVDQQLFQNTSGLWVYRLKLLDENGRVDVIYMNALTATLMKEWVE